MINIVLHSLPTSIRSFVVCQDEDFTIVLNDRLSYENLLQAYSHELCHIRNGDFEKKTDINLIESITHKYDHNF